jgi:hypothetical protein
VVNFKTAALAAGTNSITASYAGNADFNASASTALSEVTNAETTSTVLTSSPNPSAYDQSVTFTATVKSAEAGTPTGTVTLLATGTAISTTTLENGVATFKTTILAVGTNSVTASYAGNADFTASTSAPVSEVTNVEATSTVLTSALNPSVYDQSVLLTATVKSATAGTPTGTVTFLANGTSIGSTTLSGGVANFRTTVLAVGTNSITASYAGNADFTASTSAPISEVTNVETTTTVLTTSINPSTSGQAVILTATVKPGTAALRLEP